MTDGPPPIARVPVDIEDARAKLSDVKRLVDESIARAASFTEAERRQQVNDEWSAVESLQHIVFVIDVWLGKTIKGEDDPFHPIGLPPHFIPRALPGSSIDPDAEPTFDQACDALSGRLAVLASYVDHLTPEELARPIGTHAETVAGGLGVIFDELAAHNFFMNRDLDEIERVR